MPSSPTGTTKRLQQCALCHKLIRGTVFHIDKYPHHCLCQKKVLKYLRTEGDKGN